MSKKTILQVAGIIVATIAYTLSAYSWVTGTFVSKDTITVILGKIDSIDKKLDILIGKHIQEAGK